MGADRIIRGEEVMKMKTITGQHTGLTDLPFIDRCAALLCERLPDVTGWKWPF
jgi:hypothetical protein